MTTFQQDGFSVIKNIYNTQELETIQQTLKTQLLDKYCIWSKEHAASSHNILHLATQPSIIQKLESLLGPNIILWGASYLDRVPGQIHPWHTDIESSQPEGGFVTVWIGLEGTNKSSALKIVPNSHKFDTTVQQFIQRKGRTRDTTTDEDIQCWANELADENIQIIQPDIKDGDAIFFDGRLWHGSSNENINTTRRAFIFQYAAADVSVKIPDFKQLDWPFIFKSFPKPPCILVSGKAEQNRNNISDPPPRIDENLHQLTSGVHPIDLNTKISEEKIIEITKLLRGKSANLQHLTSHYSVLKPGKRPHPPHIHVDEEILIVLQGEAELHYSDKSGDITPHKVRSGDFVYYPAFHQHTINNSSNQPVVYLMFKWVSTRETKIKSTLALQRGRITPLEIKTTEEKKFTTQNIFSSPTHHLNQLHCHISTLQAGGGYDEHCDDHDIAIIVFEGEIHTLGQTVKPGEMVWCSAGEAHGMSNKSSKPARYIVFEFHGENCPSEFAMFDNHPKRKSTRLLKKRSLKRILRNIQKIFVSN